MIRQKLDRRIKAANSPLKPRACEENDQILVNDSILRLLWPMSRLVRSRNVANVNRMTSGVPPLLGEELQVEKPDSFWPRTQSWICDHENQTQKSFAETKLLFRLRLGGLIQLVPDNLVNQFHGEQFRNNSKFRVSETLSERQLAGPLASQMIQKWS